MRETENMKTLLINPVRIGTLPILVLVMYYCLRVAGMQAGSIIGIKINMYLDFGGYIRSNKKFMSQVIILKDKNLQEFPYIRKKFKKTKIQMI